MRLRWSIAKPLLGAQYVASAALQPHHLARCEIEMMKQLFQYNFCSPKSFKLYGFATIFSNMGLTPTPFWTMLKKTAEVVKRDIPPLVLTYLQRVSLKVRNHTIIKSWRQGRTIQFLLSALSEKNWGGKPLFSTLDQYFYQIHYIFQLYPSITFNASGWGL